MYQYREVLARLRAGDIDRELARSGMMGREKVAAFRAIAAAQGLLQLDRVLPDEASIAQVQGQRRRQLPLTLRLRCLNIFRAGSCWVLDCGPRRSAATCRCHISILAKNAARRIASDAGARTA